MRVFDNLRTVSDVIKAPYVTISDARQ